MPVEGEELRLGDDAVHLPDAFLRDVVQPRPFGEEPPKGLVYVLDRCLLVALEGVAEEQEGALGPVGFGHLDARDVGEARVAVGEDRGEDLPELGASEPRLQAIEGGDDLGGVPVLDQEEQREVYFGYNDDQDRLGVAFGGAEEVHLAAQLARMTLLVGQVVEESAIVPVDFAVLGILVLFVLPLPFLVGHGVGEVHLRHRHLPFLDVAVDGGDGHVDAGILHDGVERPLVPEALLEEAVELLVLLLRSG